MKAPDFEYTRVRTVEEAIALLQQHGDDARILAGGQTLLATLNMRLSEPALLVDITGIESLRGIERRGDRLWIGALATHSAIEASPLVAELAPLLARPSRTSPPRDPQRRHLGRLAGLWRPGGGMAGVPAGAGRRADGAGPGRPAPHRRARFLPGPVHHGAGARRILLGADLPSPLPPTGSASTNWRGAAATTPPPAWRSRRASTARRRRHVRLAFLGMGATPLRAPRTEALLAGRPLTSGSIEIALASLKAELDPMPDLHHDGATKQHLATVLARRLLAAAHASRAALAA
jgi:carbon-monoxide dehydrogenase medium subunit